MTIGKICSDKVISIPENSSIQEAARLMAENNVGSLLVTQKDGGSQKPIGIITDRDITIKILPKKTDISGVKVEEVMSKELLMLPKDQGIKKSIESMCAKGVRRAPVTDNDQVCGIIAVDDLLVLMASELNDLAKLVEQQTKGQ